MVIKFIYLGQCDVGQNELEDFLATGNDLEVGGLMEDVNLKDVEAPVVDNGTRYKQEPLKLDSNYTDLDDKTWEMLKKKNENEVTINSNQKEGGRFVCSVCNAEFGSRSGLFISQEIHT